MTARSYVIEPTCPPGMNNVKGLYLPGESLQRVREAGYAGHVPVAVATSLWIDFLEGTCDTGLHKTAADMMFQYGEWLDETWTRRGRLLTSSSSLPRQNGPVEFDIGGLPSEEGIPLADVDRHAPAFFESVMTRRYDRLPSEMRCGYVTLPCDGTSALVARSGYHDEFVLDCTYTHRASRGFRP